jgi:CheY-like chemotaxis protein
MEIDERVTDDVRKRLGRKPRLLVVDDDEIVLGVYTALFQKCGYDVKGERNTETAATRVLNGNYWMGAEPDVIVADLQNTGEGSARDGLGGLTLLNKLTIAGKRPIFYVGVSGAMEEEIRKYREICDIYFQKPSPLVQIADETTKNYAQRIQ